MINVNELSTEKRKFIKSLSSDFKFGVPIKLLNGTYYPVNHEDLFLRYYVSHSGYIYDLLTDKITKYLYDDMIKFISVENEYSLIFSLREIMWRTFYRIPEAKDNDFEIKIKPTFIEDKNNCKEYLIQGIRFKHLNLPVESKAYNDLVKQSRFKFIISENGAIFNLKSGYFVSILQDEDGYPYIYSKNFNKFKLDELIAYTWMSDTYLPNKYKILTTSCADIFISASNLILYNSYTNSIGNGGHYLQNLAFGYSGDINSIILEKNRHYNIPIYGLYGSLLISQCGSIITNNSKLLKPYKIVYGKSSNIKDVYYQNPKTKKVYSIIDIYMWSLYRLTRQSVYVIKVNFIMSPDRIPIIDDLFIVTKTQTSLDATFNGITFGNERFIRMTNDEFYSNNYFLSKHGAIFYTRNHTFIPYTLSQFNKNMSISIPLEKSQIWINIKHILYSSWSETKVSKRSRLESINGVPIDISVYNIIMKSINDNVLSHRLTNILKNINCDKDELQKLVFDVPIPEVII